MSQHNPRPRILIVDDVPSNVLILSQSLGRDYEILTASSGEDALKILFEVKPDLLLLDIMMPDMDGYEVCRRVRMDKSIRNIPVIFLTAKGDEEDETRGLEIGAVDYIVKPFSIAVVRARVRAHIELKMHRDFLESLSSLDGLTGIPNRRYFEEIFEMEWGRALRRALPLSFIMIDIDHFKAYNDGYGHGAGDECLRQVAQTLHKTVRRPPDFVSRYGGEEFSIVLPETDMEGAMHVAELMRSNIESLELAHAFSPVAPYVTVSVGVATIVPVIGTPESALREAADKQLYEAKAQGRNRVRGITL